MPKHRKFQLVHCQHFRWRLMPRDGVWYADGRSNKPNPGRHSLNTRDLAEAKVLLPKLDGKRAVDLGLVKALIAPIDSASPLSLEEGRRLYERNITRPIVAGGVKASTAKRYRSVFDKFIPFAAASGANNWSLINDLLLNDYATHLDRKGYASKSIRNELVTVVQAQKWLISAKHLIGREPIKLQLRKVESERPYCYSTEQVAAMVEFCRANEELSWLCAVIVALATTGLRIAELAGLRWSDIDPTAGKLTLTDETGRGSQAKNRRQLKSGRSRSLPIHADLAAVLKTVNRMDAFVFHGPRKGRLKPDTVRRVMIRDVLAPLAKRFPMTDGEKGFADGRLHSFRHYFASMCANRGVPERVTMQWLGHADSDMVRHYYHLHDEEAQRQMRRLDPLGEAGQQRPGDHGAANINKEEAASQESDPTIAP